MSHQRGPKRLVWKAASPAKRWVFGAAELDERSFELRINGKVAAIEAKPLAVLGYLLRHAGDVVTKGELAEAVWSGRIVNDAVLTKAVEKLRAALGDKNQELVRTVHGYGYRLVAPVRTLVDHAPRPAVSLKSGDRPANRPLWRLARRLGAGGNGEAWLAEHDKTHEQRVFKFAIDEASLVSLKREITLYRFLRDSLRRQACIVPVREWNLETTPCFVEFDFIAGGNLVDWSRSQGGLKAMPLQQRLALAAQLADALATVHSVGVLHKDLKPSNILIEPDTNGAVRCLLGDLGSGGMLDPKRLESLGITRLGFSKTVALLKDSLEGTPLYLAPELLRGHSPTVKADIYALGVVLYQLVVGDFRKTMSAGWEREVDDELLRECITDAAHGDIEFRLADATILARRLRSLDQEREKRRLAHVAERRAAEMEQALLTARSNQAVADFLGNDLFAAVGSRPMKDLTIKELLAAAAARVQGRFKDLPLAAAQVHAALGNALWSVESFEDSRAELRKAVDVFEALSMQDTEIAVATAAQLMLVSTALGDYRDLERHAAGLEKAKESLGPLNGAVLKLQYHLAFCHFGAGQWRAALEELDEILRHTAHPQGNPLWASAAFGYARVANTLGEYTSALEIVMRAKASLPPRTSDMERAQLAGMECEALFGLRRFEESEKSLQLCEALTRSWVADSTTSAILASVEYHLKGRLRLAQGRAPEAVTLLASALKIIQPLNWVRQSGVDGEVLTYLAQAHADAGQLREAVEAGHLALSTSESKCGSRHPLSQIARVLLAELLVRSGKAAEGRKLLRAVDAKVISELDPDHPSTLKYRELKARFDAVPIRRKRRTIR